MRAHHAHKRFNLLITTKITINDSAQWQVVKDLITVFPDIGVAILAGNFFMKAVLARNLSESYSKNTWTRDCP